MSKLISMYGLLTGPLCSLRTTSSRIAMTMPILLLTLLYLHMLLYWCGRCDGFLVCHLPLQSCPNRRQMTTALNSKNEFLHESIVNDCNKLSRGDLQSLAKENNVRANLKSVDIIAALKSVRKTDSVNTEPVTPTIQAHNKRVKKKKRGVTRNYEIEDENDDDNDEYLEVLKEQGLNWSDIFAQAALLTDPAKPKRVSVKRERKANAIPESTVTTKEKPVVQTAPVQYLGKTLSSRDIHVPTILQRPATRQRNDLFDRVGDVDRSLKPFSRIDKKVFREPQPRRDSMHVHTRNVAAPIPKLHIDLEGTTLKAMLEYLIEHIGYETLHRETHLRCFVERPSMSSSLKVLRQPDMEWARKRIEYLFITEKKKNLL